MDNLYEEMLNKGFVSCERQPLFGDKLGVSDNQKAYWTYFESKFAKITKMRLQHTILPCQINQYSRN